jgi:membrane-associated phospholipid phosphatase
VFSIWDFVTDFGDSAVTVPLSLLVLVFLWVAGERGHRRVAVAWVVAIGAAAVAISALKLVFGACETALTTTVHIVSPSGHTAMSTAVYGSLALLIGGQFPTRCRRGLALAAAILVVAIGWSRVVLHDHSRAEMLIGFLVGAGALALFRAMLGRETGPPLPLKWLLLCGAVVIAVMHGTRWMIEPAMHRLAWDFRLALPWCR